jgi:hypothetical protein
MNTIIKSVIELDYIQYEKYLTSDEISSIVEDFEAPFGDQEKVKMVMKATPIDQLHPKYHPKAEINTRESIYQFSVDIHLMNPFDETVDAMVLQMQLKAFISYTIDENFKLYSEAKEIEAEFTKIDAYFKTRTTEKNLNDRLQFIRPFAIGYLNSILDEGIEIPIPEDYKEYIKDPRVRHFEHFLFIDAEFDYNKPKT